MIGSSRFIRWQYRAKGQFYDGVTAVRGVAQKQRLPGQSIDD